MGRFELERLEWGLVLGEAEAEEQLDESAGAPAGVQLEVVGWGKTGKSTEEEEIMVFGIVTKQVGRGVLNPSVDLVLARSRSWRRGMLRLSFDIEAAAVAAAAGRLDGYQDLRSRVHAGLVFEVASLVTAVAVAIAVVDIQGIQEQDGRTTWFEGSEMRRRRRRGGGKLDKIGRVLAENARSQTRVGNLEIEAELTAMFVVG